MRFDVAKMMDKDWPGSRIWSCWWLRLVPTSRWVSFKLWTTFSVSASAVWQRLFHWPLTSPSEKVPMASDSSSESILGARIRTVSSLGGADCRKSCRRALGRSVRFGSRMTTCFFEAVVEVEQVVKRRMGTGPGGGVRGEVTTLRSPRSESSPRPESWNHLQIAIESILIKHKFKNCQAFWHYTSVVVA